MKKYIIFITLLTLLGLYSCEEYLDVNPNMGVSSDEVYSEYTSFRGAVDVGYNLIYNPMKSASLSTQGWRPGSYADEGQTSNLSRPIGNHNLGGYEWHTMDAGFRSDGAPLGGNSNMNPAGGAIYAIRAMNLAMANKDLLTEFPKETDYSADELRDQLIGQCYYLRGFHYFEIIKRMGAMPRMDTIFTPDTQFDVERPSYQQSTEWLVADLDKAIELLPESWNDQNKGRATKTSARALKAMALLYAASPNMVNTDFTNGIFIEGTNYSQEYLERALAASIEAIKSAEDNSDYEMLPFETMHEIWWSNTSELTKESIIQPSLRSGPENNVNNAGAAWWKPPFDGGWSGQTIYPTQNAVEWFETADGYDIKDAPSGSYDASYPYENRDPRLREWIYVNGDDMYLKPTASNKFFAPWTDFNGDNGYHYKDMVEVKSLIWTGYVLKGKFRWPGNNNQDLISGKYRCFPYVRFSQLYLDFAEIANELYGPESEISGARPEWSNAVKATNIVRARSNMPGVRSEYTSSKNKFRERLRNERAVELFWEGHRWNDIKRWRIAKDLLKEIRGSKVVKDGDNYNYGSQVLNGVRVFEDKHYWYPFTQATEDMFLNFKQNPGW